MKAENYKSLLLDTAQIIQNILFYKGAYSIYFGKIPKEEFEAEIDKLRENLHKIKDVEKIEFD